MKTVSKIIFEIVYFFTLIILGGFIGILIGRFGIGFITNIAHHIDVLLMNTELGFEEIVP